MKLVRVVVTSGWYVLVYSKRISDVLGSLHQGVNDNKPGLGRFVARGFEKFVSLNEVLPEGTALLRLAAIPFFILGGKKSLVLGPVNPRWTTTDDAGKDIHFPDGPPCPTTSFFLTPQVCIDLVVSSLVPVNEMHIEFISTPDRYPKISPRSASNSLNQ